MTPDDDGGLVEVGVFTARSYRLATNHATVTALAPATVHLYRGTGRFQIEMSHPTWHVNTNKLIGNTALGDTVVVQCWTQQRPTHGHSTMGWNVLEVDAVMHRITHGRFMAARNPDSEPAFTVAGGTPPTEEAIHIHP